MFGLAHYRIKAVEKKAEITTSPIVSIYYDKDRTSPMKVYPNPIGDESLNIELVGEISEELAEIDIIGPDGREMQSIRLQYGGEGVYRVNANNWPSGIYIIRLVNGDNYWTVRLIVAN